MLLISFTRAIHPNFGPFDLESLALVALPLALAALAQACIVISGGIDLSVGSLMAVANVLAARTMQHADWPEAIGLAALVLVVTALASAVNGIIAVVTRVPDVMVTLTTGFIYGGIALLILNQPGGGAPPELLDLTIGGQLGGWLPHAFLLLCACVLLVWVPMRRSRLGLVLYAIGSDRVSAFRAGINVNRTRVLAYAMGGVFAGLAGISMTLTTGIGSPLGGNFYTLTSIATIVLGGVSLSGGQGGAVGPLLAALVLSLIPMILIFLNLDPNFGQVIQGTLLVLVVMVGGLVSKRRQGL